MRVPVVYVVACGPLTTDAAPGATQIAAHEGGGRTAVDVFTDGRLAERVAAFYGDRWSVVTPVGESGVRRFVELTVSRHPDWVFCIDPPNADGVSLAFHDAAAILQALCEAPYGAPI